MMTREKPTLTYESGSNEMKKKKLAGFVEDIIGDVSSLISKRKCHLSFSNDCSSLIAHGRVKTADTLRRIQVQFRRTNV